MIRFFRPTRTAYTFLFRNVRQFSLDYNKMTVNQLKSLAHSLNVDVSDCLDKQDILEVIRKAETSEEEREKIKMEQRKKYEMPPMTKNTVSFANPLGDDSEDVTAFLLLFFF